ncbi:AAA family ATPase [Streptomyces nigra]|uniref:AAA family ATPase n=1 Tax=Streptomyces nigra TaxID=1827580 RepID=UPI003632082C
MRRAARRGAVSLTPDSALHQAEAWLATPHRLHPALAIRGAAGSGKTALLQELSERLPNAIYVDCRGLEAADIARRLLREWGSRMRAGPWLTPREQSRRTG